MTVQRVENKTGKVWEYTLQCNPMQKRIFERFLAAILFAQKAAGQPPVESEAFGYLVEQMFNTVGQAIAVLWNMAAAFGNDEAATFHFDNI